jgi:hypothetical protein
VNVDQLQDRFDWGRLVHFYTHKGAWVLYWFDKEATIRSANLRKDQLLPGVLPVSKALILSALASDSDHRDLIVQRSDPRACSGMKELL